MHLDPDVLNGVIVGSVCALILAAVGFGAIVLERHRARPPKHAERHEPSTSTL
jgi:hypothetical protein